MASSAERRRLLRDWIDRGAEMVRVDDTPDFLLPLISALRHAQPNQLSINDPPADEIADRQAAVLILLGGQRPNGIEVVMIQRASGLRDHPGEISFPGGSWEQGDTSPVDTALREAAEETGVDPAGVTPLLLLPRLFIRASGFDVSAVVGYWRQPSLLAATDPAETERAFSIALHELAQPRRWLEYAVAGWRGPSTRLDGGVLLWGYTAEVLMFMSNNI